MASPRPRLLLTGATGFIGGRLLAALDEMGYQVRSLQRTSSELHNHAPLKHTPEIVRGDLLKPDTLPPALENIDVAYYLVHSMSGRKISEARMFAERDRIAASNFTYAAGKAGVKRIIYLSGLGDLGSRLSRHLGSRQEVGEILRSGTVPTTVLRAAVIIGAGGASFEMIRHLVDRLPVILCPAMVNTLSQPIAVENAMQYLTGCLREPETTGEVYDIGGPEIVSYRDLMQIYARVRRLRRIYIKLPVSSTRVFAWGTELFTPLPAGIVAPLLEGLKNETICRDKRIRDHIPLELIGMETAIRSALAESG